MNSRINQSIIGGIVGTAVMSFVMYFEYLIGLPKINPGETMSSVMKTPIVVGWIMIFIIGIFYAFFYTYVFARLTTVINSNFYRGVLFGFALAIFVFLIQIVTQSLLTVSEPEGSKLLFFVGNMISHLFYGICIGLIVQVHVLESAYSEL
ncbi:MAG TPA: DUF6789 family protein [Saprospiraceae bacterium]|nr:DUF6789 family protein [Saprospiraceae bacterium]